MSQAETDDDFRKRVLPLADEADRPAVIVAIGRDLDTLGRRYGRFRTGVALAIDAAAAAQAAADELGMDMSALMTRQLGGFTREFADEIRRGALQACREDPDVLSAVPDPTNPTGILVQRKPIRPLYYVEISVPSWQPPPSTVVGVAYPQDPVEDGPVHAYLIIGRCGSDHMLRYLFLGGDPTLAKVEAVVRDQFNWPGYTVVVDLGQAYASHAAAEARVAAMREYMPTAVTFFVGDLDPQPASAAS